MTATSQSAPDDVLAGARAPGPASSRRVSMADVARRAGVSSQTVSRVSNGYPGVVEETRHAVLVAMHELGYRPNGAARALKLGEFRTIGVLLFTLATIGNMRTLEAIATSAAHAGYAITLIPVQAHTQDEVRGAFTRLGDLAVDAIVVVMEVHLIDSGTVQLPPGVPVVVVDSNAGEQYAVVDTDQADGARQAVEHLLGLGHRTVWHVAGPADSYAASGRAQAWDETLRAHGREVPEVLRGDWSALSGYTAGLRLAAEPTCTAVFSANDQMALGLLRAFQEQGRAVPGQISVVGFDDVPDANAYTPPLTTMHQDFAEVGRRCVELVVRQIAARRTLPGRTLVGSHLVLRASTAPPPDEPDQRP